MQLLIYVLAVQPEMCFESMMNQSHQENEMATDNHIWQHDFI